MSEKEKTIRRNVSISKKSYDLLDEMFETKIQAGFFLTYVVEQAILQLYNKKDIQINIDLLDLRN